MIKGIYAGRYINVQGGAPSSTYISNSGSAQGVGNMRYNTQNQNVEVWDGNNWTTLAMNYATIELTGEAQMLLEWARNEQTKQLKRDELIKNNPALQKAYEAVKRAEANFDLIEKFVENDNDGSEVQASP